MAEWCDAWYGQTRGVAALFAARCVQAMHVAKYNIMYYSTIYN